MIVGVQTLALKEMTMYELELESAKEARLLEAALNRYRVWVLEVANGDPDAESGRQRVLEEVEKLSLRVHELSVKLTVAETQAEDEVWEAVKKEVRGDDPQPELEEEARQEREMLIEGESEEVEMTVRASALKAGDVAVDGGMEWLIEAVEIKPDVTLVTWKGLAGAVSYFPSQWLKIRRKP